MKYLMIAGEYLVGLVILLMTLLCILVASLFALAEFPRYLRLSKK